MATINSSTTHAVKKKAASSSSSSGPPKIGVKSGKKGAGAPRGSVAPQLQPSLTSAKVQALAGSGLADLQRAIQDLFRTTTGAPPLSVTELAAPHAASSTRDRSTGAANLALAAKEHGVAKILKQCGILSELVRTLFPDGMEALLNNDNAADDDEKSTDTLGQSGHGLKPSTSAVSLTSLTLNNNNNNNNYDDTITYTTANSGNTDSQRGKTTPPAAREGCLLLLRALCETVGRPVEPYICGAFLAATLDECASTNSYVRQAAEDTSTALIRLGHPYAFGTVVLPVLLRSLSSKTSEWRIKAAALERLSLVAPLAAAHVPRYIPTLVPAVTNQVWDTKAQVSKGARSALLAICSVNTNRDIAPAIPAVVQAICKPSETNRAVSELMGTTFVVPVDASTLAILVPVLARALKEKLAIHKRAACIVISNMSKLVETPQAVAPFGNLLVPELEKVAQNVQFEEIRDESLKALANLTKALGDQYRTEESIDAVAAAAKLQAQKDKIAAEQERIQAERDEQARKAEELRVKEAAERVKYKEAMDAQRRLDDLAKQEAAAKKAEEAQSREMQKLSTKGKGGACQGCGLKKCKPTCMFHSSKK